MALIGSVTSCSALCHQCICPERFVSVLSEVLDGVDILTGVGVTVMVVLLHVYLLPGAQLPYSISRS